MKDLSGQRFGMLTIINFSHRIGPNYFWLCRCDCGTIKIVRYSNLKSGTTQSCGCGMIKSRTRHGLRSHKIYRVYHGMIQRCYCESKPDFKYWGGRGIIVCEDWIYNRKLFFNWAFDNGWKEGLQLDRINNNGNYSPENCRFVTRSENCKNRRPKTLAK